jgi:glycine dehydrogenase subunit 1
MLKEIGFESVDQIYEEIPEVLRFKGTLDIPKSPASELQVSQRITAMLAKNRTTDEYLSFLGAGCWPHYVPAVCDDIISRSEFLTAYSGQYYSDLGRHQTVFEYQSMIADLLEMDIVGAPVYDGASAAGDAVLMASRVTDRPELLVPELVSPDRLSVLKVYCGRWLEIRTVRCRAESGEMDLADLRSKVSSNTAAVYFENPTYLGVIESQCEEIGRIAHASGALLVAFVNPISLGVLAPPGQYGADIACGEGQPLGMHQGYGGNSLGILATKDEERLISQIPVVIEGMVTTVKGETAYARALPERTCYSARDKGRSFTGSSSWLWAISSAVYLSLMGPQGMRQVGEVNLRKAQYAMSRLSEVPGIKTPVFSSSHFNEFLVNFDGTGKSVQEVNEALFRRKILGGKDVSKEFPWFGNSALYCTTEVHTQENIDLLVDVLREIVR